MTLPKNAARLLSARFATTTLLAALGTTAVLAPISAARAADPPSWSRNDRNDKNDKRDDRRDDRRDDKRDDRNSRWDNRRDNDRDNRRNDDRRDNDRQDRERREREARERLDRENRERIERERFERDHRYSSSERDRYNDNWRNDRYDGRGDNRQNTKNTWRNLGILSGATAIYGLLKHDNTITFIGAAGALYSASRYDQDRRSQNDIDRARVAYFDQGYFDRDGVRYNRHEKWQNGQKYYYFSR